MFTERKLALAVRMLTLAVASGWLTYVGFKNEVPADSGDGIMHYFYAQAAWKDPVYFLHHWGKPFFILLSSPFAQFGFNGMIVFNLLVFVSTVWLAYRILDHFKCNFWIQTMLPLLLILANDFTTTITGGLTEPLFNLSLVLALYLFIKEKYVLFAILISFMPFMRSEGQLPVLLAAFMLTFKRSFRSLPYLGFGFLLYAIAGLLLAKNFFWYFTESPYHMGNDIYGRGTWDHYLISYRSYLGNPGLYASILGTVSLIYLLIKRDLKALIPLELLFTYGLFVGVVVVHSYFWATGQNGSLGLTRIATQGMPLFIAMQLYLIGKLPWLGNKGAVVFSVASVALIWAVFNSKHFPVKAKPLEQHMIKAAEFLKENTPKHYKVHYHNPFVVYSFGENPFIKGNRLMYSYFHDLPSRLDKEILPGEFIVWDSHFGPQEAGLPLDTLTSYSQLVKVFGSLYSENDGPPQGVLVYQYVPVIKQKKTMPVITEFKLDDLVLDQTVEFAPILKKLPEVKSVSTVYLYAKTTIEGLKLVYDRNRTEQYISHDLKPGEGQTFMFDWPQGGSTDIYIWNPSRKKGKVILDSVRVESQVFHPVMP